jgi:hypothetical protein
MRQTGVELFESTNPVPSPGFPCWLMVLVKDKPYLKSPDAGACSITGALDLVAIGNSFESGH